MINLHLGDCLEAMRQMPDKCYDLAIVDPPYFQAFARNNYTGNAISTTGVKRNNKSLTHWHEYRTKIIFMNSFALQKSNHLGCELLCKTHITCGPYCVG
jgi:DNA modification methylase